MNKVTGATPVLSSKVDPGDEQFARNAEAHRALVADLHAKLAAAAARRPGAVAGPGTSSAASCCPGTGSTRWSTRPRRSSSCPRWPRTACTAARPRAPG